MSHIVFIPYLLFISQSMIMQSQWPTQTLR